MYYWFSSSCALNDVENKIHSVSYLVKQTNYDAKISDIDAKCFKTNDYNKFGGKIIDAKMEEKWLVDNSDRSGFIDNSDLDKKIKK